MSTAQFAVPTSVDRLTAADAGAAIVQRVHISLEADGAYHFTELREDGEDAFMVLDADGAYHLNTSDAGARMLAYFPGTNTVSL